MARVKDFKSFRITSLNSGKASKLTKSILSNSLDRGVTGWGFSPRLPSEWFHNQHCAVRRDLGLSINCITTIQTLTIVFQYRLSLLVFLCEKDSARRQLYFAKLHWSGSRSSGCRSDSTLTMQDPKLLKTGRHQNRRTSAGPRRNSVTTAG